MSHEASPHGADAGSHQGKKHERTEDRARYRRVREAFDDLRVEDQAVFLAEAAAGVVARGIEQAGHAVADALDELLRTRPRAQGEERGAKRNPNAAAPPPPDPPPPPPAPEPPADPDTR